MQNALEAVVYTKPSPNLKLYKDTHATFIFVKDIMVLKSLKLKFA